MARVLEVDELGRVVWIEFSFDPVCLDVVKCLPARRFDAESKRWSVPIEALAEAVRLLEPHGFSLGPRLRVMGVPVDSGDWKVGALNRAIDASLKREFSGELWLTGELSGYKRAAAKRPVFFEIVERSGSGDVIASIPAMAFWDARMRIKETLSKSSARFEFQDGVAMRVRGKLSFSKKGRMLFLVQDLDPAYTVGALQMRRERILIALQEAGIAEKNLALPLAPLPLRVALITSDNTDAQADFLDELSRSGFAFRVTHVDARMQGQHAETTVLAALRWVARRRASFDLVAIVRGGGARSDLSDFDTEAIGRAVCEHPCKIVVGVGHHLDRCLLDDLAYSTKTPTAAAAMIVDAVVCSERALLIAHERLARLAADRTKLAARELVVFNLKYERSAERGLSKSHGKLEVVARQIAKTAAKTTDVSRAELASVQIQTQRSVNASVALTQAHVHQIASSLDALDPRRVLERGFAFVKHQGKVLRAAQDAQIGQELEITLRDGRVLTTVKEVLDE